MLGVLKRGRDGQELRRAWAAIGGQVRDWPSARRSTGFGWSLHYRGHRIRLRVMSRRAGNAGKRGLFLLRGLRGQGRLRAVPCYEVGGALCPPRPRVGDARGQTTDEQDGGQVRYRDGRLSGGWARRPMQFQGPQGGKSVTR